VVKRCEIRHSLLLITNRKSHKPFHMTWTSLTLDDLERALRSGKGTTIGCSKSSLATAGLLVYSAAVLTPNMLHLPTLPVRLSVRPILAPNSR